MPPKVPDIGHRDADKELYSLTRRLHLSYRQASISLREKIEKYLDEFEKEDAKIRALYDSGKLSDEDFSKWREQKTIDTQAWRDMLDQLAEDMTNQNKIAASMINETLPEVYAINHNYGTYEAETGSGRDTTYTMYDKFTVKRLLQEGELQLPKPSPKVAKDKRWNRQHIQSAVLQGILTGEPMKDIAQRLLSVAKMTESAAIRNARTAVTGAENAGRIDSYIRAQNMGIKMKQVWMATLDSRTRDSHAMMDGEKRDPGKEFSNGCRYPGDPEGKPGEIYNCRCTLVAEVEGSDAYDPSDLSVRANRLDGMSYEEWKTAHSIKGGATNFDDELSQKSVHGYERYQQQEMESLLKNSPDNIQNLYRKYGDKLSEPDENVDPTIGPAYYSHTDHKVHMHKDVAAAGNDYEAPYQQHFHEYMHNLAHLAGNGQDYSVTWRDEKGRSFEDIIQNEWDKVMKDHYKDHLYADALSKRAKEAKITQSDYLYEQLRNWRQIHKIDRNDPLYLQLRDELDHASSSSSRMKKFWASHYDVFGDLAFDRTEAVKAFTGFINANHSKQDRAILSDMFGRYSVEHGGNSKPFWFGHKPDYVKKAGNLSAESFANLTAGEITNKDAVELVKKYLPDSYSVYLNMLEEMSK